MQSRKKKITCIAGILCCAGLFMGETNIEKKAAASAIGTVKVEGCLNVRKGPGTNYAKVQSGGSNVTLSNGIKITITGIKNGWYHVTFTQNSKKQTGYVKKDYVQVLTGKVYTSVTGKINVKSSTIRTKASATAAVLNVNKKQVSLQQNAKVNILSETYVKNEKWYHVSFVVSSKTYKGYIVSKNVNLVCDKGLPATINQIATTNLYSIAGKNTKVTANKKTVLLKKGNQITILGQKKVSGIKYNQVKVTYNKVSVKGYLSDKYTYLQMVKNESTTSTASSSTTTQNDTSSGSTGKNDNLPSDNTNTTGMTESEYKKHLSNLGFPSTYINSLVELHKKYPKWQFVPYKTGLKWDTVISKESAVGLNLLSVAKDYAWKSTATGAYNWKTDKYIPYDGSTWVTASMKAVRYYMDPRNFLDERGIFQFECLEYQKAYHTQSGVENILKNTPMYMKSFSYKDTTGTKSIKYSAAFMKAAQSSLVSPYHLASRVKQEVVVSATKMSNSVSGTVTGYKDIYNFYNIGANNSTVAGGAIANGLNWAKSGTTYSRPWNNRYKSIVGGASYIGKNYINVGQNTLYLQKFNVTEKNRYNHQYMGNIEAPNSEATKTNNAYGTLKNDVSLVFSIPVYTDMPDAPCDVPSGGKNPNNYLKSLSITGHAFDSKFVLGDDGSKIYTVTVDKSVSSVTINATKVSSYATITGTGTKQLSVGTKTYTVNVKSASGNTRSYKIKITRKSV